MIPQHGDRLSSTDAKFLHLEDGRPSHMHIGGIGIFEGPVVPRDELSRHIEARLALVPRYRQKLSFPPLAAGRPVWIDDPDFQLGYHLRYTALPSPGGRAELLTLAARVMGQRLDRARPLWEMWVVEGLEDGGFAILSKSHHAMVDGISGVDILTAIFDLSPDAEPGDVAPWEPQSAAGSVGLLARAVSSHLTRLTGSVARGVVAIRDPGASVRTAIDSVSGLGQLLWQLIESEPPTPLNGKVGPHRRIALLRRDLADLKAVKNGLGGTINDAILTAVAGAVSELFADRGIPTAGKTLRCLVPVSLRPLEQRGALGNQITALFASLPLGISDPVLRLRAVRDEMDRLKGSNRLQGAQLLTAMEEFAPPTVLAQASRLSFSPRLVNLVVTNVPGPQFPIYLRGRTLTEVYPLGFLAADLVLMVALMSYNGFIHVGLLADYDAMPDVAALAAHLDHAIDELVTAARPKPATVRRSSAKATR